MERFLSVDDVQRLTGYVRPAAQRRALSCMGVPFRVRPDGRPIVLVEDLAHRGRGSRRASGPDLAALDRLVRSLTAGLLYMIEFRPNTGARSANMLRSVTCVTG